MKAKLIKTDKNELGYILSIDVANLLGKLPDDCKLSLKNCQAIERGYDLDELSEKFIGVPKIEYDESDLRVYNAVHYGFKKALEILGDKNVDLLKNLKDLESGLLSFSQSVNVSYLHLDCKEIIQSLQQTEWDCIIFVDKKTKEPLLDNEGNLILKRR